MSYLPQGAREVFAAHYPEVPHVLEHRLISHPLLEIGALAQLAERLPSEAIEYAHGEQPIGISAKPTAPTLSAAAAIRSIANSDCWVALKNVESNSAYRVLMLAIIEELRPAIAARTGAIINPQAFIFITSPGGVTPYHFDPEHNLLLQIRGAKVMTQFPAGDPFYAPDEMHESYHTGGPRELAWRDEMLAGGRDFSLQPGEALLVPVMAPHFVRNGPEVSISLSVTWRSEWSYAESAARAFNAMLRAKGLHPRSPGRWPRQNQIKAYGWRAMQRLRRLR